MKKRFFLFSLSLILLSIMLTTNLFAQDLGCYIEIKNTATCNNCSPLPYPLVTPTSEIERTSQSMSEASEILISRYIEASGSTPTSSCYEDYCEITTYYVMGIWANVNTYLNGQYEEWLTGKVFDDYSSSGTWDVVCGPNADVDNDGIPDFLDADTIYGNISGDVQKGITVNIYHLTCGVPQPYDTVTTDAQGYYAIGDLPDARYLVGADNESYSFAPGGNWVDIPQPEVQSYDFTSAICNILSDCEAIFNDQNDTCDIAYSACVDAHSSAVAAWNECLYDVCQGGLICNGDPIYVCGFPPTNNCNSRNESCLETATNEMDQCVSNLCQ